MLVVMTSTVIFVKCESNVINKMVKVTVWVQLTNDSDQNVYFQIAAVAKSSVT